jgi:hypothetical protein
LFGDPSLLFASSLGVRQLVLTGLFDGIVPGLPQRGVEVWHDLLLSLVGKTADDC